MNGSGGSPGLVRRRIQEMQQTQLQAASSTSSSTSHSSQSRSSYTSHDRSTSRSPSRFLTSNQRSVSILLNFLFKLGVYMELKAMQSLQYISWNSSFQIVVRIYVLLYYSSNVGGNVGRTLLDIPKLQLNPLLQQQQNPGASFSTTSSSSKFISTSSNSLTSQNSSFTSSNSSSSSEVVSSSIRRKTNPILFSAPKPFNPHNPNVVAGVGGGPPGVTRSASAKDSPYGKPPELKPKR